MRGVERPAGRFGEDDDDCYTFENFSPKRKLPLQVIGTKKPSNIKNENCFNELPSSKNSLLGYQRKLLLLQIRATGRRRLQQYYHHHHHPQYQTHRREQKEVSYAKSKEQMVYQDSLSICNHVPDICGSHESPRQDDVRNYENSHTLKNSFCEGKNAKERSCVENYALNSTRHEQKQQYPRSTRIEDFDCLSIDASESLGDAIDIRIGYRYNDDLDSPSSTTCGDIFPLNENKKRVDHHHHHHHQRSLQNKEGRHIHERNLLSSTAKSFTKWSVVTSSTRPSSTSAAFPSDGSITLSSTTSSREGGRRRRKGVRVIESLFCRSSKLEAKNDEWFVNPSQTTGATKQTMVMDVFDGTRNRLNKYQVVYNI